MAATIRRLLPCRCCSRHVFVGERACPFCGVLVAAALAVASCGGITQVAPADEPVPVTDAATTLSPVASHPDASAPVATSPSSTIVVPSPPARVIVLDAAVRAKPGDGAVADAAADAMADPFATCVPRWDQPYGCPVMLYRSPPPA